MFSATEMTTRADIFPVQKIEALPRCYRRCAKSSTGDDFLPHEAVFRNNQTCERLACQESIFKRSIFKRSARERSALTLPFSYHGLPVPYPPFA